MIYKIADNILSPLGETTEQNYQAVMAGSSALKRYDHLWDIPEPFSAALFSDEQNRSLAIDGLTRFESLVVRSVRQALASVTFDVAGRNVAFILSTTKANVGAHGGEKAQGRGGTRCEGAINPGESARRIARVLGLTTTPVVVCNACVSGLSAMILASRLLEQRQYDYAVVCGADVLSRFVMSGFLSLKSVSASSCRPFDIDRQGLNLGEAAATVVLGRDRGGWAIRAGAVRNDAFDITAPSKKGEGAFRALESVMQDVADDELALLNAHGVATLFMDQMESVAISRAGLADVPVNSLKGYFGHTLGAAGVLETVLTMYALERGVVIGTAGFEELGVSEHIEVSAQHQASDKHCFIKMLSGFGGCNAALLVGDFRGCGGTEVRRYEDSTSAEGHLAPPRPRTPENVTHRVVITPTGVTVDGEQMECQSTGKGLLTELYKKTVGDYPRYYKMDMLCRLGFIASELLIRQEGMDVRGSEVAGARGSENSSEWQNQPQVISRPSVPPYPRTPEISRPSRAVVLFNHSSSIHADEAYQESISDVENYYPSPALFVYTLPSIVTGEIAIRNGYHGETSFYILPQRDAALMAQIQQATLQDATVDSMITGWLDYEDETHFEAELYIMHNA